MTSPLETAREAWGAKIPDWVEALARECEAESQNKVAAKMSRSASAISAVLRCKYRGSYEAIEETFRGVFQDATIECPALGTIPANICRDWQLKAQRFASTNFQRVRMYRACHACPKMKGDQK